MSTINSSLDHSEKSLGLTNSKAVPLIQDNKLKSQFKERLLNLIGIWIPYLISSIFSAISFFICTQIISRHFDIIYYDAVSIGISFGSFLGIIPFQNLLTVLETFVSQGFGRQEYKECIRTLFITIICFFCYTILISFVFIWGKPIIYLFVGDTELISLIYKYLLLSIPYIAIYNYNLIISSFCNSIQVVILPMALSIFSDAFNPLLCFILVTYFHIGYFAILYSCLICETLRCISFTIMLIFSGSFTKYRITFYLFYRESWVSFLKLGIPTMIFTTLEGISYEILLLSVGRLSNEYIAANSMLNNIFFVLYMIPCSIGVSVTSFVGYSLGENNPKMAIKYILEGSIQGGIISFLLSLPILIFKLTIATFCFQDLKTIKLFSQALPFMLLFSIIETFHAIFQMALNSMGKQIMSSIIGIIIYGFLLLCLGFIFMFALNYAIIGFWMACIISSLLTSIGLLIGMICTNFNQLAQSASKMIE